MIPFELLARSSDDSGVVGFCVVAAFVIFMILAKMVSSVSPNALAKKIRELQDAAQGRTGGGVRREASTQFVDLSGDVDLARSSVGSAPLAAIPVAPRKKRRKAGTRPAAAPAPAAPQGELNLRQAVIYAEILAPPLSMRHRRAGLLRSAPWVR